MATTRVYRCAMCARELKPDRWIYSSHTGNRYCYVGEGCWIKPKKRRKAPAAASPETGAA